jgi:hypothetical protein
LSDPGKRTTNPFCNGVSHAREAKAMSEVEFDRLLEAVRTAIAAAPGKDSMIANSPSAPPQPANDNDLVWPLIPFPDGWNAAF